MDNQSDFERMLFFEHARKTAEASYSEDPLDVEVSIIRFSFVSIYNIYIYIIRVHVHFIDSLWFIYLFCMCIVCIESDKVGRSFA